jgi:serine/threonine-protein kinase RsbW
MTSQRTDGAGERIGRLERTWPAVPGSVREARAAAADFARDAGASPAALAAIRLAVSEAVTNTVLHAYRGAGGPGPVELTADREPDGIRIVVSDAGTGMRPRAESPGSGLGLPLIAQMTEGMEIERQPSGGTRLQMRFAL